jgi:putative transport protein
MQFFMIDFISNQFVLMFFSVVLGLALGKVQIRRFYLGTSGGLFVGLPIGWAVQHFLVDPWAGQTEMPAYAVRILRDGVISICFFQLTLILFVAAVGLLAARDLNRVLRSYGAKLVVLGFVVPFVGAAVCYVMAVLSTNQDPFAVAGVYTGALTSSPGLAAAIETVSRYGKHAEGMVGFGHAIGYSPGVIMVILAVQTIPLIFGIDIEKERLELEQEFREQDKKALDAGKKGRAQIMSGEEEGGSLRFDIIAFLLVALAGYFLGSVRIYLGRFLGYFSLGSTGGVLIGGLIFGYIGQISLPGSLRRFGRLDFRMDPKVLTAIRELSLSLFLAIVGLRYGYTTINSLVSGGLYLVFVAFLSAFFALLVGFLLARYVFKLNWIILVGSLCGAMTSTPGLGVAIDSVGSDDAAVGYGATYPFALLGMVIFTILLHNLPM